MTLLQHETGTPLHLIMGFAELLKSGASDPMTLASHTGYVLAAARELNEKLRRIFYYAQASTGALCLDQEQSSTTDVVEEAIRAMRSRAAARQIVIELQASHEPAPVLCDLRHLGATLQELLANAVAHSPAGGRVEVEVAREDNHACISIRDHGPGISPETLARCLEPFAQATDAMTRSHEGLGLGLPLARSLIERHGGRLSLTAGAPGLNARILLPLSSSAENPETGRSQAA